MWRNKIWWADANLDEYKIMERVNVSDDLTSDQTTFSGQSTNSKFCMLSLIEREREREQWQKKQERRGEGSWERERESLVNKHTTEGWHIFVCTFFIVK